MNFDTATPTELVQYYIDTLHWKLLRWELITTDKGEISKRPVDKDYQNKETTVKTALQWLSRGYQIGLVCNKSGLVVVDDDRDRMNVKNDISLDSTIIAKTLRGGTHYYYKHPEREVHNDQNPETHVDIRANGWVAIPPSRGYEWVLPPDEELVSFLPDFPETLEAQIRARKNKQSNVPDLKEIMSMKDGDGRNNAYHLWCCSEFRRAFNTQIREVKRPNEKVPLDTVKRVLSAVKSDLDILAQVKAKDFADEINEVEAQKTYDSAVRFTATQILTDYTGGKYDAYGKSGLKKKLAKSKKFSEMSDEEIDAFEKLTTCPIEIGQMAEKFPFPTGFYITCASPGSGKSWFSTWLIRKMWEKRQIKSVLFTIEMSKNSVKKRILQSWSDLNKKEFDAGFDTASAKKLLKQDVVVIDDFASDDQENQTIENFIGLFEQYYADGYRAFHIDHIHEVEGAEIDFGTKALTAWANCFKDIKNKYPDVWLFMVSQPNGGADKKPHISKSDFQGTKFPIKKCDYFISLNRLVKNHDHDKDFVTNDGDDRRIMIWVDKTRNTEETHFGTVTYFGWDGNFYTDEAEAAHLNPSAVTKQCVRRIFSNEQLQ